MCWSVEISVGSALVGWATCAFLYLRNRSPRDRWYARYLLTFTFTQLIDIALWTQHQRIPGGLQACDGFKEQFSLAPTNDQYVQFIVSKFVVPLVVFSQYAVQLSYPSKVLANHRTKLILLHALPLVGMAYQFACSDLIRAKFPASHETLRWGGHTAEMWQILFMSGVVAFDFWLLIPEHIVAFVHIFVLGCVMTTIYLTEQTLALGSKWCTYCLIYSFVYIAEPIWGPKAVTKNPKQSKPHKN
eukprot:c2059_g1_i1.p1 GENE.c2059_g1_i1~~c2059_g1_i1.p1  ORF type:complete len:256 (+),score=33.01 c2059_g1_i1:38-769(+)